MSVAASCFFAYPSTCHHKIGTLAYRFGANNLLRTHANPLDAPNSSGMAHKNIDAIAAEEQ